MPHRKPRIQDRAAWLAAAALWAALCPSVRAAAEELEAPEIESPAPAASSAPAVQPSAPAAPSAATPGAVPAAPSAKAPASAPADSAAQPSSLQPPATPSIGSTAPDPATPPPAPSPGSHSPSAAEGSGTSQVTSADTAGSDSTGPAAPETGAQEDEADITVEVDPRQSRNRERSLPLAMLLSATLPGAGEIYLHERPQAKAFLLAEAGFWAALYGAFLARDAYLASARNYASEYAGIDASRKSSAFLETMANYRSYLEKQHRQDSYEMAQILSGKRNGEYPIKPVESNYWDFGSSVNPENTDHWNTFQSTLRHYRASKVVLSFAVGALALNRLASLANTLRIYKHTSAKGLGLNVVPEIGPESAGSRITLSF